MDKKQTRLRRARKTRARIAMQKVARLSIFRSNCHMYAQIIDETGSKVLASASTVETELRAQISGGIGGNVAAAVLVGKRIAEKARAAGIERVAFDRSGFAYHGRVKALADSARENGLVF